MTSGEEGRKEMGVYISLPPYLFSPTLWSSSVVDQTPELHGLPHIAVTGFCVVPDDNGNFHCD